ncbi:molybdenum cofactor biosynthesis protein [Fusarium circinatum]|uniref:Molybdenum cofactor biosynthesis protein n=1 Tax=Fusarium circinatum TaxID=48490 RepID=A0A8H5X5W3_FUSCI|nr:molybdenum cofactor biosynthesis protein [Fusarium circinatum]
MVPSATSDKSDYIPVAKWPTLQEMADGFREHLMPASNKLEGKYFEHTYDNGWKISNDFGQTAPAKYEAFEVRPDVFFVDFFKPDYNEVVTLIVDTVGGQAIAGVSGFKDENGERRTFTSFINAVAFGGKPVEPFLATDELIGKHVLYRYTPRDAYEHVYLNKGTMTWHCLSGTERGIADAEKCQMLKLGDSLYMLFWTETVMPVDSVVVIDLEKMRSTGRFYCWDPKPKEAVHVRFGSYATVLAETSPLETLRKVSQNKL